MVKSPIKEETQLTGWSQFVEPARTHRRPYDNEAGQLCSYAAILLFFLRGASTTLRFFAMPILFVCWGIASSSDVSDNRIGVHFATASRLKSRLKIAEM
jgi:hypothetical protein